MTWDVRGREKAGKRRIRQIIAARCDGQFKGIMRTSKRNWSGKRDSNSRPQPWQARIMLYQQDAAVMVLRNCRVLGERLNSKGSKRDWSGKRDSNSRPRPWQARIMLYQQDAAVMVLRNWIRVLGERLNSKGSKRDWSGKRDSNSRPRPWQGRALPTELFPQQDVICK